MAITEAEGRQTTLPIQSREELLADEHRALAEKKKLEAEAERYKLKRSEIMTKIQKKDLEINNIHNQIENLGDVTVNVHAPEQSEEPGTDDDYPSEEELAEFSEDEGEGDDDQGEEEEATDAPVGYLTGEVVSDPEDANDDSDDSGEPIDGDNFDEETEGGTSDLPGEEELSGEEVEEVV